MQNSVEEEFYVTKVISLLLQFGEGEVHSDQAILQRAHPDAHPQDDRNQEDEQYQVYE